MPRGVVTVLVSLLVGVRLAGADGGHAHGAAESSGPPAVVWLVALVLGVVVVLALVRQARRGGDYVRHLQGFSRNAKLLVLRTPFSGLSVSMWRLLFYLYLLALGHDTLLVARLASLNWLCHGLAVIPSGILSDLFGRRRIFLISYAGNVLATAALVMLTDPSALLVVAAIQGVFEGGHAIVGPPFMVEQSRPDERVHLFSMAGFLSVGAASIGSFAAGVLPVAFGHLLGLGPEDAFPLRASLACAIPVMLVSMVPIYLIDEAWQRIDVRRWWESFESYGTIGMLAFTEFGAGLALGMTAPFFNVFFARELHASTAAIGLVFALGSTLTAFATLLAPLFVRRLGRVRTVAYLRLLGIPFLALIALAPSFLAAAACYVVAIILIGGAFPSKPLSDPIYTLFAMEVVKERERGTTNGIMHAFSEFPMGIGAWIAGPFMAHGAWSVPYALAAAVYALTFVGFLAYFSRRETLRPIAAPAPAR